MSDVALVVEGSYPYVTGGVSEWTQQLVEGLPDVSFSIVSLGAAGRPRYDLPANVADLVDLEVDPDTGATSGELPDAAVYHALATGSAGVVAAAAARARGSKFILSEHGIAWLEARLGIVGCKGSLKGSVTPATVEAQARRAYAEADAITAVCGWSAHMQHSLGGRGSRVIQNAVPAAKLTRTGGAEPLVGFVGRVVEVKDVLGFLEACRLVADELPSARFVVAGPVDQDPAYAERCHRRADELSLEVTFTGSTDPRSWYERLDALVLTSRSEAQPLVALEAMAAGIPVVATAVGGCPELLGGRGLLTRPGDPRGTANAVLRVLRDEALRERITAAALRRVEREHRPDRLFAAYSRLYEDAT